MTECMWEAATCIAGVINSYVQSTGNWMQQNFCRN